MGGTALLVGCSESDFLSVDFPPTVDYYAAISIPSSQTAPVATPLVAAGQNLSFESDPDAEVFVLGYRAEDLPLDLVPEEEWGDAPLTIASGCQLRLPPPVWVASRTEGSLETIDGNSPGVPELTAAWLERSCPGSDAPVPLLETVCRSTYCEPDVVRSGCRLRAQGNDCLFDQAVVVVDWLGRVCVETPACQPLDRPQPDDVLAQVECPRDGASEADCPLRFVATRPEPTFVVERVTVRATPPDFIPPEVVDGGIRSKTLEIGYLSGTSVYAGRVAVVSHELQAADCSELEGQDSRIHVFDEETLAPIATATAPRCLTRLESIDDQTLFGAFFDGGPAVGRFDLDGRLLERVEVTGFERRAVSSIIDARVSPNRVRAVVAYATRETTDSKAQASFFVVDLPSLTVATAPVHQHPPGFVSVGDFADADHFVFADTQDDRVTIVDLRDGSIQQADLPHQTSLQPTRPRVEPSLGIALVPVPADAIQIQVLDLETLEASAHATYGAKARPVESAAWKSAPPLRLVGVLLGEIPDLRAGVRFFDPVERRFLADTQEIGGGSITEMVSGSKGDVFAALPWRGELVRIRPKTE